MLSVQPGIRVPDPFSRLCRLKLHNTRICYGEITDILQEDQFLKVYVQKVFAQYLKKGGMLGMLTALGWEGFRNRLAEAYLYKARFGKFPDEVEMDEVYDVLDIEKRFEFLTAEGNSRAFLFGFYLKLCDIAIEKTQDFVGEEFITIPTGIDELLIKGKSRGAYPDWLIVITWVLIDILGEERSLDLMRSTRGKFNLIVKQLDEDQYEKMIERLLNYGFGINDVDFIIETKV